MTKTVIALYDSFDHARQAVEALVDAGFSRDNISVVANDTSGEYGRYIANDGSMTTDDDVHAGEGAGFGAVVGTLVGLGAALIPGVGPVIAAGPAFAALFAGIGAAGGAATGGLTASLVNLGASEDDAGHYAEGVRRGGALLTVHADDNSVSQVQDILERYNPMNIRESVDEWSSSGYTGFNENASDYSYSNTGTSTSGMSDSSYNRSTGGEQKLEVVEEEIQVGKRQVEGGGVRIHKEVTETPVEEQITLREEHVHIERNPVNRPATEADFADAFREETIEMTERSEQPVVSKQARVVEEIIIGKDVNERTETIRDTVRRTDVEVEQMGSTGSTMGSTDMYMEDWRGHYNTNYANSGYTFEQFTPAYRYGYNLANNQQYRGRQWTEIESDARMQWEERNPGTWDQFKDSVRNAWERVTR
jgi:uncharacterized protein (TIGR02271 family)